MALQIANDWDRSFRNRVGGYFSGQTSMLDSNSTIISYHHWTFTGWHRAPWGLATKGGTRHRRITSDQDRGAPRSWASIRSPRFWVRPQARALDSQQAAQQPALTRRDPTWWLATRLSHRICYSARCLVLHATEISFVVVKRRSGASKTIEGWRCPRQRLF